MSYVQLVSITIPRVAQEIKTAEDLIAYTARVSNPGNQLNTGTAPKLLSYLIKNSHWSPFEMASMCVEIGTSRAIAQQILRHRSFSFQEFSQRYAEATRLEPVQLRRAAEKNRQSSTEEFDDKTLETLVDTLGEQCIETYHNLIQQGVAKECARMILPLTTKTTIYMSGTVRSWIHYLQIRDDEHTQLEHRLIAKGIRGIFEEEFPTVAEAISESGSKYL